MTLPKYLMEHIAYTQQRLASAASCLGAPYKTCAEKQGCIRGAFEHTPEFRLFVLWAILPFNGFSMEKWSWRSHVSGKDVLFCKLGRGLLHILCPVDCNNTHITGSVVFAFFGRVSGYIASKACSCLSNDSYSSLDIPPTTHL